MRYGRLMNHTASAPNARRTALRILKRLTNHSIRHRVSTTGARWPHSRVCQLQRPYKSRRAARALSRGDRTSGNREPLPDFAAAKSGVRQA